MNSFRSFNQLASTDFSLRLLFGTRFERLYTGASHILSWSDRFNQLVSTVSFSPIYWVSSNGAESEYCAVTNGEPVFSKSASDAVNGTPSMSMVSLTAATISLVVCS